VSRCDHSKCKNEIKEDYIIDESRKYQIAWIKVDTFSLEKNKKYFIPNIIILPFCLKKVLSHKVFNPKKLEE